MASTFSAKGRELNVLEIIVPAELRALEVAAIAVSAMLRVTLHAHRKPTQASRECVPSQAQAGCDAGSPRAKTIFWPCLARNSFARQNESIDSTNYGNRRRNQQPQCVHTTRKSPPGRRYRPQSSQLHVEGQIVGHKLRNNGSVTQASMHTVHAHAGCGNRR